jgi:hypothetical protein
MKDDELQLALAASLSAPAASSLPAPVLVMNELIFYCVKTSEI